VTIVAAVPDVVGIASLWHRLISTEPVAVTFVAAVPDVVQFVSLWQQRVAVATFDSDKARGG
jgi:hypothetical protein